MRQHLIVVVPGIGGSVLAPPGGVDPVWSVTLRDLALLRDPELLDLSVAPDLVPVGLIASLKLVRFWTVIDGYEGLLNALMTSSPDPTVLAVPYDFRKSIVDAARHLDQQVRARLWRLWPDGDHRDRVIVVAHSMGGLVARYWVAPGLPADERDRKDRVQPAGVELCRALVTLGTPHRGAPKALDVLANGVQVRGVRLVRLSKVVQAWPALAELLPRYPVVVGSAGDLRYPHELPLEFQPAAAAAFGVHSAIERAWDALPLAVAPAVEPRIGYGHATLRRCIWDGRRVTVTRDAPMWPGLEGWDRDLGDGTVPAVSGLPLEMNRHRPDALLVSARHGQLGTLDAVRALVDGYEGRSVPRAYRGEVRPATLGLAVEELQLAGEAFDLMATVHGVPAAPEALVMATVRDAVTDARIDDVPLRWDDGIGGYRATIPAMPPGGYLIEVVAPEMPNAGQLLAHETVEVLGDDDLD